MINKKIKKTRKTKNVKYKTKNVKRKTKNKKCKTKKRCIRGGGYKTLKTGEKYSMYETEQEILDECGLKANEAEPIFPPFNDNEIYIWINNRCKRNYSEIIETNDKNENVKVKQVLLPAIWGHCAFSFDPNNGPIYGYSVNVDDLYDTHVSKEIPRNDGEYTDSDGYLNFDTIDNFNNLIAEFEAKSYNETSDNIQMYPGVIHVDTEMFKAIYNEPGCEIHRFTLFTQDQSNDNDINDYINTNNGVVDNSVYGIYKKSDKCYGSVKDINVYNCITYITNKFKPYFYEKKKIGTKCIFSKTEMDTLGKYCGSLGMMIEKLKLTVGAKMYNQATDKTELPSCLGGDKTN